MTCTSPPTAKDEFDNLDRKIRETLNQEITRHQADFEAEFGDWNGKLREKEIRYLRDVVLDDTMAASIFLREWYNNMLGRNFVEIDPIRIEFGLGDFAMEVYDDACEE